VKFSFTTSGSMRKVAAPTSWWDVPEQDVITMPEISNSGAWVKNLNPIWSILILGASLWSINPTCCKPGGVLLHGKCEDDGPTMQVKLNENRSHKKGANQERETEIILPFTKQWQSQKKTSYSSSSIMTLHFLLQELIFMYKLSHE
jgi:hypothetical protein